MQRIQTLPENLFAILGPRLFNCLPMDIRGYEDGLDGFKRKLDRFLSTVPEQPGLPHYHQSAGSNTVLNQVAEMRTIVAALIA